MVSKLKATLGADVRCDTREMTYYLTCSIVISYLFMWLQRIKSLGDICKTTQLLCTASPAASGVCSVFQGGNLEETWAVPKQFGSLLQHPGAGRVDGFVL